MAEFRVDVDKGDDNMDVIVPTFIGRGVTPGIRLQEGFDPDGQGGWGAPGDVAEIRGLG